MSDSQLASEILDLGEAIGLFDGSGNLQPTWFENPLNQIESILTVDSQRAAFLRVLDALLPPVQSADTPANETWHPLLGTQARGNAYLTVNTANGVTFGFAGDFSSTDGPPPMATLTAHLPLVNFSGGNVTAVAGSAGSPLEISLQIQLGFTFPADPIGLETVIVTASFAPLGGTDATISVDLKGLQLDASGAKDVTLDPANLGSEAIHLIVGFIREQLSRLSGASGEAASVADHLLQLLGFGTDGIPQFPFTQLSDPAALNAWFVSLLQGSTPPMVAWLGHLTGLLGASTIAVSGTGTASDPWVAPVLSFGSATDSGLNVTLASQTISSTTSLLIGMQARVIPSGATPTVRIEGNAILAALPITGTGSAVVLPSASVIAHAPGALAAGALVSNATITLQSVEAGFSWTGSTLQPLLELEGVDFTLAGTTTHYDQVDLTNASSVASDVSSLIGSTIAGLLGSSSPGRNLAALTGLVKPENDPSSPHTLDLTQLVSNPARAIAQLHRAVLLDTAHPWSHMLEEIGGLAGLTTPVAGSGTRTDPWVLSLATPSTFAIDIAAWNDLASGSATDPQKLRVGLRASLNEGPVGFYWLAELLAFDLPQTGAGTVSLMAGQHVHLGVQPIPTIPSVGGLTLSIGDVAADMTWSPGSPLVWTAGLQNLSITSGTTTINVPTIGFPLAAPFDVSNPAGIAADFGLTIPELELLLRLILARAAYSWGGMPAYTLAGLLGVHGGLSGLSSDWPALADPGAPGSLLSDPFGALRGWINAIAIGASADGTAFLPQIFPWLRALLSGALPAGPDAALQGFGLSISGSGTYDDPWALPITTSSTSGVDALVWMEPAGPPTQWATPLVSAATNSTDLVALLQVAQSLAGFVPDLRTALIGEDLADLAIALGALSAAFAAGDGVVPLASQVPASPGWTAGTTLTSAHSTQPGDPEAIQQILAQIDNLAGGSGGARSVLLLGPAFSDHSAWTALLTNSNLHGTTAANTNFNLRVPGLDPSVVDLTGVTAQAAYYTADLNDDGTGNVASVSAQIGRVVARMQQLNGTGPVTLVAHSTAGLGALAFTAANPSLVQGLITLGTPHLGSDLPFLSDSDIADAIRVVQVVRPQLAAGPLRDALDFIVLVLDGSSPPATAGSLPTAFNFEAGSFPPPITAPATINSGGKPVLAIGSQLGTGLFSTLQAAFSALAGAAANPVTQPAAPTHLAFGVRAHVDVAQGAAGNVAVDTTIRGDLFQLALKSGAAVPSQPAHALRVRATLTNPNGWLVGASSSFAGAGIAPVDVRVRWAEIGADISSGTTGLQVQPVVNLNQVSWHGPVLPSAAFSDANTQALLGAVLQTISSPAPAATSPAGILLATLQAINVAVVDSHGGIGISADAFAAITADAAGYLGTQLTTALNAATSFAGFVASTVVIPSRGALAIPEWTLALNPLPLEIYLLANPWTVGLRTSATAGQAGWPLTSNTSITLDASVALPAFTPVLDASFTLGALTLVWTSSNNQLAVSAAPWLAPLTLIPAPGAAALESALSAALPRLLFSGAASAALEALAGPGLAIGPIDTFFTSMSSVLTGATALGNSAGTGLDSTKLTKLLQLIATTAGLPPGPGLTLPGDLQITATGAGTTADPVTLKLATTAAIGGVLNLAAGVAFDSLTHPSPTGSIAFTIPLPAAWSSVTVNFGASSSGVTLSIAPAATPPIAPIQILPTFSGLGSLAGAAEALLPQVLDATVSAIGSSTMMTLTLDVASALGLYDTAGGFAAHADELKAMLNGTWLSGFTAAQRGSIATAIAGLFSGTSPLAGTLPGTVSAGTGVAAGVVTWALPLTGADTGTVAVALGWDAGGPTATVSLADFKLANGALGITATAGFAAGSIAVAADLGVHLEDAIGINVVPALALTESGGKFQLAFYPLAGGSGNGPITINFIPPSITMATGGPVQLIEQWLVPLVGNTLLAAVKSKFTTPLWTGGPQLQAVLTGAKIAVPSGGGLIVNPTFPGVSAVMTGLISTLATGVSLPISNTLNLVLANDGGRLGVRLQGSQAFPVGEFDLTMLFGAPTAWGTNFNEGVAVYLFEVSGATFTFNPAILAVGLGIGLSGQNDAPLINTDGFRMGGVNLYTFFWGTFSGGFKLSALGAGVEVAQLGLPLSQATGGNVGGNNPVASSLLSGGGTGGNGGGDSQPLNPAVDVSAWYWEAPTDSSQPTPPAGDSSFHILFSGNDQPIWIGVHAQLGPVYLNQIGIILNGNTSASLVLDATVKVGPLTGEVDELGVTIPFKSLMHPGDWTLDLKGLALSFQTTGITLAGALLKNDSGPAVEYDGMLLVQITEFGLVAVGAYSKPTDAQGDFTSVFIFAGLFIIIGIPPVIEIDAIGLGVGYNRELIVPDDINQIPTFILVAALDDGGALANDPMGELMQIRNSIPAKRGSLWFAVGLHGTTFVIVHVTAIVYVALDRGVEIGVLGVARMAIPSDDTALVSVELALKARYSSAEGILSIQAQLTSNSYIFDQDCQLTGGFAYFMWFPQGQFVLTLGGYNPNFQKPTQFPDVPRLGFRWGLPIGATIKGETYFALTNTCIMAGGRLDLTYGISCAYIWFTAYADFLISWDPFFYNIDLGISVGATFSIQACFWGVCIGVSVTVSVGATLTIAGPPLHGVATVNLDICSITVAFGDNPNPRPPYITDFNVFATKYLYGGDANGNAFRVNVLTGLVPPEPSGAAPAPGTVDKPWKMVSEFSFQCDTKMPATKTNDFVLGERDQSGQVHTIDLAPMNEETVDSEMVISLWGLNGTTWTEISVPSPNPDADFQIDTVHWTMTPIIGKVSEATWHWNDPTNMPAAANTIPAVVGFTIKGFCYLEGITALIPISKLYATGNYRPLPFATAFTVQFPIYQGYGAAANLLADVTSSVSSSDTLKIASAILSGSPFFADERTATGMPAQGSSPVANRALLYSRSAPPLIVPITTGLTMAPPALPAPPVIVPVAPVLPVVLEQPRLHAVLRGRPQVVSDAPPALRTTVVNVSAAKGVARMAAPLADALGSRLVRVAAPSAPAATRIAKTGNTLRSTDLGWTSGTAHRAALSEATSSLQENGLTVPAGTTHIWDLPANTQSELVIAGDSAFRITFLTRGGSVITDSEYAAAKQTTVSLPANCGMIAIECLGIPPAGTAAVVPGFAAVAFTAAPSGKRTVCGWQAGNLMAQVGPAAILGRGSCLKLPQTYIPVRKGQAISQTMIRVSDAVAEQIGTETWLPTSIGVVMILLDLQDGTASGDGDLALSADGATLAANPVRVLGGRRRALLYDVSDPDPKANHITIGVASITGWRVSGVVGMAGSAQEWATSLQGKVPEHIVPDGPLTPNGSITVRLAALPVAAATPVLAKGAVR